MKLDYQLSEAHQMKIDHQLSEVHQMNIDHQLSEVHQMKIDHQLLEVHQMKVDYQLSEVAQMKIDHQLSETSEMGAITELTLQLFYSSRISESFVLIKVSLIWGHLELHQGTMVMIFNEAYLLKLHLFCKLYCW